MRRLAAGAGLSLALACGGLLPPGAGARVSIPGRIRGVVRDMPGRSGPAGAVAASAGGLSYAGGSVLHSNRTHLIFWQPNGSGLSFDPGYEAVIEAFLANVARASHSTSNVFGLTGQYTDAFGPAAYASRYGGAVLDQDPLPANGCVEPVVGGPGWTDCLTDSQLQQEIEHVVRTQGLPTRAGDVYFLVTPKGLGNCMDASSTSCALGGQVNNGYCGYHSYTPDGVLRYAVIPYNAVAGHCQSGNPRPNGSTADPALSTISHELNETITDPWGDAWINNSGYEDGDLCITSFGPAIGGSGSSAYNELINGGRYFLQEEWSNASGTCRPAAQPDRASFVLRRRYRRRRLLSLAARAADPEGHIIAYRWSFGDGRTGRGAHVSHRFPHHGYYLVTLRVTDNWLNWRYYTRRVHV